MHSVLFTISTNRAIGLTVHYHRVSSILWSLLFTSYSCLWFPYPIQFPLLLRSSPSQLSLLLASQSPGNHYRHVNKMESSLATPSLSPKKECLLLLKMLHQMYCQWSFHPSLHLLPMVWECPPQVWLVKGCSAQKSPLEQMSQVRSGLCRWCLCDSHFMACLYKKHTYNNSINHLYQSLCKNWCCLLFYIQNHLNLRMFQLTLSVPQ